MEHNIEEKQAPYTNGMLMLLLNIVLFLAAVGLIVGMASGLSAEYYASQPYSPGYIVAIVIATLYLVIGCPILLCGLKVLKPNEALVLTLFGKYYGTLKEDGFYYVNPFCTAYNPTSASAITATAVKSANGAEKTEGTNGFTMTSGSVVIGRGKKVSLKSITLNNEKQKINDELGNPIIIGIVVIWRVVNTAKAVFNVDNYVEYLSTQCDSALRNIVRLYPYDTSRDNDSEKTLRSSSQEISQRLRSEIQEKVNVAGLEIQEARITHLAYAPEIAAVMLQRQQASAIIDARQMIVDGAVGMVEMALKKLSDNGVVDLDEERKAAMVSNLMVVLCGSKEAQPVVNSGSLY
jgi:regulator of protease activity HflC (stomatin/prohibitin superfamily)